MVVIYFIGFLGSKEVTTFSSIDYKTKLSLLGILKGKAEIKGDILNPIDERWDANI